MVADGLARSTMFFVAIAAATLGFGCGDAFTSISAGSGYTCGIAMSGATYCWGYSEWGRLGNGLAAETQLSPARVASGRPFRSLAAGDQHACALDERGAAYCWGLDMFGQLGSVVAQVCGSDPVRQAPCSDKPILVSEGLPFASVSAGGSHTCGVGVEGIARCWGANHSGQLGTGLESFVPNPVPMPVAGGLRFASVSAGRAYTCGITIAGQAFCWGLNDSGQVGNGQETDLAPNPFPVPVAGGITFTSLETGDAHACGITHGGEAYCWGDNFSGQLGAVTSEMCSTDSPARPPQLPPPPARPCSTTPVAVAGGLSFALVTAGLSYTCGLTMDGVAYCWGWGEHGQLGTGSPVVTSDRPAAVAGKLRFESLTAGSYHTCGITRQDAVFCWGNNSDGPFGNGSTESSLGPVPAAIRN